MENLKKGFAMGIGWYAGTRIAQAIEQAIRKSDRYKSQFEKNDEVNR